VPAAYRPDHTRIAWSGPSWRLRVDTLTRPDGSQTEKGLIEHPGSVVLVPLRGEQVLMLRQYRPALAETILELPAGTREEAEPWLECAQRELREETGYRAAEFTPLGHVWPAPGLSSEVMAIYLATGLTPDPLPADFDEQIELVSLPLANLVQMALDGQMQDAKSAIALLRTRHWQQEKS
jgi:ADP-ribose pyrophosphatase